MVGRGAGTGGGVLAVHRNCAFAAWDLGRGLRLCTTAARAAGTATPPAAIGNQRLSTRNPSAARESAAVHAATRSSGYVRPKNEGRHRPTVPNGGSARVLLELLDH